MATNLIALEFDSTEIRVVAGYEVAKQLRARAAFSLAFSEEDDDEQIGEKLKKALADNGVNKGDAIVAVARAKVEIREITVPPAPDNELPNLVRFKSKADFATVTDDWSIDFVPLSGNETTEREVLAAALPNQDSQRFASICQSAGLKLKSVVLRPFATLDLLPASMQRDLCLVADPNGDQIDLTLTHNGSPLLTRTVRVDAEADISDLERSLSLEIKRTLASAQKRVVGRTLSKIVVTGASSKFGSLSEHFSDQLECETEFVDPFNQIQLSGSQPESPEKYSSLIGCLLKVNQDQRFAIDFLNARKAVVEKTDNRRTYIIAGALAAVFLCGVFLCWSTLRSQKAWIAKENKRLADIKKMNEGHNGSKSVDQMIGEVGKIDEWMNNTPNWLDELDATSQATLDADHVVVDKFYGRIGKDKSTINMQFRLKEMSTSTDLEHALADRSYVLSRGGTSKNKKSKDFPVSTELDLELARDMVKTLERMDAIARNSLDGPQNEPADEPNSTQ